eukprot:Skav206547  [mRNA]  locus=scaffold504:363887:368600:+ [translate_table: standard]
MHGDFARKISPSEEALATYILKRSRFFQGRRVLVLGAGLGLAGFLCASCTRAREVSMDYDAEEGQSDSVQRICQRFAELREQKQQEAMAGRWPPARQ